jgi:hypothetical protein
LLRYVDDDHCDLLRNGRQLLADITWQTAKQWLRKNVTPQDNILREESDGYRVPVKLSRL